MDRRSFLRLAGASTLGARNADLAMEGEVSDLTDEDVRRGIDQGDYRLIGNLRETNEVVISVESSPSTGTVLHVNTLDGYASAPDSEPLPDLTASIRWPTISIVGRTPYRVQMLPTLDRPSPSVTAFIAFDSSVGIGVYVRPYQHVDMVALVERR